MAQTSPKLPDFDKLWDHGKPAETEVKFRAILPAAGAAEDKDYLAELKTQIARCHSLQRQFDKAQAILDEVESGLAPGPSRPRLRLALERGRTFNSSGKKAEATVEFLKAWDLGRSLGQDGLAVDAAHMMGIVEPPDTSLEWNLRALDLAESSRDENARKWLGSLYNNIGWTYHDGKKDYPKALELFEKALEVRKAQGQVPQIQIAHWCVAKAHRNLGHLDQAFAIQNQLLEDYTKSGQPDGYVHEELAELWLLTKDEAKARAEFRKAYEILVQDPWLLSGERERLERMRTLGGIETPLPASPPAP